MSGTSLDGIDVAIVDIDESGFDTVAFHSEPYADEVRQALLGVSNCETHTREIARLHFLLPELYAESLSRACKAGGVEMSSVELIGCHGQTIYHEGDAAPVLGRRVASTLQIGDGSVLAERTGITVVSDFRTRDIAAGGKGAPLVPFVDYLLFGDAKTGRAVVNIGGIANVTLLPAGAPAERVLAFDTGPGNMVMDQLASRFSGGRERSDRDGAIAARGKVDAELLQKLMSEEYYRERPPKTAGREQYGASFVERMLAAGLSPEDIMATAAALTAGTIADGIYAFGGDEESFQEAIVSGGGVHNPVLMAMLRSELADMDVMSSEEMGLDPDAKEAIAFAILAHQTWKGKPGNLPSATGAKRAVVLGKVSPG
jgi:anhydro-N-acetylmuramic acid kinase